MNKILAKEIEEFSKIDKPSLFNILDLAKKISNECQWWSPYFNYFSRYLTDDLYKLLVLIDPRFSICAKTEAQKIGAIMINPLSFIYMSKTHTLITLDMAVIAFSKDKSLLKYVPYSKQYSVCEQNYIGYSKYTKDEIINCIKEVCYGHEILDKFNELILK